MEKIFIENEYLKVGIKLFGAELTSVISKETNTEYMYQPDGIHWNKQSQFFFQILEPLERIHFYMKERHTLLESMDLHGIMPSD